MSDPLIDALALPRYTRINPPARKSLSYRAGTYATVLQDLIDFLATNHDPLDRIPMLRLDTGPQENWGLGLLQALAMVIDVLTFYQERIANEGYLRTATELRSVVELTRLIGYQLRPAVSASTYLAFTVRSNGGPGGLPLRCVVPQGLAVQSVPTQGRQVLSFPGTSASQQPTRPQLPQIFETSAQLEARAEWNSIAPAKTPDPPDRMFWPGATSLRLNGTKSGLRPGDTILIVGDDAAYTDQDRPWIYASLTKVEPDSKNGFTRVSWGDDAIQSGGAAPIRNHAVFALRQQAKLYSYTRGGVRYSPLEAADWTPGCVGLPNTAVYALVTHSTGSLFAATDVGVFRSGDNGDTWGLASTGLMKMKIHALLSADDDKLYAGSTSGNLFSSVDDGNTWQAITARRTSRSGLGALLFGAGSPASPLPRTAIRALASYTDGNVTYLVAGMDNGVFTSADGGGTWQQSPSDVSDTGVGKRGAAWAFAAPARGKPPLVAMDSGVFPLVSPLSSDELRQRWRPWFIISIVLLVVALLLLIVGVVTNIPSIGGQIVESFPVSLYPLSNFLLSFSHLFASFLWSILVIVVVLAVVLLVLRWRSVSQGRSSTLPRIPFRALVYRPDSHLLAACGEGIFRSTDGGQSWTKIEHSPAVQTFAVVSQDELFAGTQDGSVLRSVDGGSTWAPFSQGLRLTKVEALTVAAGGLFAAGQPDSSDPDDQWTRFQLQRGQIDLDKLYPQVTPGSWVVMRRENDLALFKTIAAGPSPSRDFKRGRDVTSVRVDGGARGEKLAAFARNATTLAVQSERLALFDNRPLQGDTIPCDRFVPGMEPGQSLSVSGKRIRLRVAGGVATPLELVSADGLQRAAFTLDDTLVVMAPPVPAPAGGYTWLLRDRNGFVGSFTAPLAAISYEPADEQDEAVSELVVAAEVQQQEATTVILDGDHALVHVYDRSSVAMCANVVPATHGQTIQNEVLGSVDISRDERTFTLKQKPLTYLSSVTAEEDQPATLTVQVNGVPWNRVTSFFSLGSDQRAYIVRHDNLGNTSITFGDGEHGAHLPGGQEHITATYRVGGGAAGNVPANSLTLLRSRPPGVQQVTNPVPAGGGADAESMDGARGNAPLHLQCMERIVTLNDYEHFVRVFAGVSKVQVKRLWKGRGHVIYITVVGEQGQEVAPGALLNAINAAVSTPSQPVYIDAFEPLFFQLEASLVIEVAYAPLASAVIAQARSALADAFGFASRELGQSLSLSEVVASIQSVAGVAAVKLTSLYLKGQPASLNTFLEAHPGRIEGAAPRPAQLLLINGEDQQGIVLNREEA